MLPSTGRGAALFIRGAKSDAVREHPTSAWRAEVPLVRALCSGDEAAFAALVDRHHLAMVRLASVYVRDRAVAEEVAQETWLAALNSITRFEGRSSVKTWLFRILVNVAMKRGVRERRSIPFSAAWTETGADTPSVAAGRFQDSSGSDPDHWAAAPASWRDNPEERLLAAESRSMIERAIADLPGAQREVITLRDVEGWSAAEVCETLGVSDGNQRVLLHRARSRVRTILEEYLEGAT